MKKQIFLLTAMVLAFTLTVSAQNSQPRPGNDRPQPTPKERAEKMAKDLELTAEQAQKVEALFVEQGKKMTELREKYGDDREGRRAEMQELRKKWDADLEAVIGKEKMEKHRAAQQEQWRQGREGRENRPRPQR